jgi:hypothetical protein
MSGMSVLIGFDARSAIHDIYPREGVAIIDPHGVSLPKMPSGLDSHRNAESSHHLRAMFAILHAQIKSRKSWRHHSDLGWAASPIHPDMIFGKYTSKSRFSVQSASNHANVLKFRLSGEATNSHVWHLPQDSDQQRLLTEAILVLSRSGPRDHSR